MAIAYRHEPLEVHGAGGQHNLALPDLVVALAIGGQHLRTPTTHTCSICMPTRQQSNRRHDSAHCRAQLLGQSASLLSPRAHDVCGPAALLPCLGSPRPRAALRPYLSSAQLVQCAAEGEDVGLVQVLEVVVQQLQRQVPDRHRHVQEQLGLS